MTAKILDGLALSNQIKTNLKNKIKNHIKANSQIPCLTVVLVGNNPASEVYVRKKQEACQEVGIKSEIKHLPSDISESDILKKIQALNENSNVHGILVQLPLPEHHNPHMIFEAISPQKDVDGFHPYNLGRLAQRHPTLRPCTPYGIMKLLEFYNIDVKGKDAVIIGSSTIVGRPMALELLMAGATITVCHRLTKDLKRHVQQAEILIAAIGNPSVIQSEWIKKDAIVIDVGINRTKEGKIRGDIDFHTAKEKAAWITPVPGGVGPMTVATLLENTYVAALGTVQE